MAAPVRLTSLNIGSQTIGLAEFRVEPHGGLVLLNYRLLEAPLDPATGQRRDAHTTLGETAVALRDTMTELHIKQGAVNYALPAQSVFARFVKLPTRRPHYARGNGRRVAGHDDGTPHQTGRGELCVARAIGLRAFCETASAGRGKAR